MIRQANEHDTRAIEEILFDAVSWMNASGLQNLWNESNVKWAALSKLFKVNDFYLAYENRTPVACMALTDYDPLHWPDIPEGNSLYLHKLAVKRAFAGKGFSKELIDFAKKQALLFHMNAVRLDCNQHRKKLRSVYENQGFVCVKEITLFGNYDTALYVFKVKPGLEN